MWVLVKDTLGGAGVFPESNIMWVHQAAGSPTAKMMTHTGGHAFDIAEIECFHSLDAALMKMVRLANPGNLSPCGECHLQPGEKCDVCGAAAGADDDFFKAEDAPPRRTCRVCGCTDRNCAGCIAKTGEPCSWVEADLCSACAPDGPPQTISARDYDEAQDAATWGDQVRSEGLADGSLAKCERCGVAYLVAAGHVVCEGPPAIGSGGYGYSEAPTFGATLIGYGGGGSYGEGVAGAAIASYICKSCGKSFPINQGHTCTGLGTSIGGGDKLAAIPETKQLPAAEDKAPLKIMRVGNSFCIARFNGAHWRLHKIGDQHTYEHREAAIAAVLLAGFGDRLVPASQS